MEFIDSLQLGVRSTLVFSILFDIVSIGIILTIAAFAPRLGSKSFKFAERGLRRLGRHRALVVCLSGVLALILSVGISLLVRIPVPKIHDEFSYLLAADTFAQGRITNPTHPLWVHFESMQIIHQPSYASKYPPGQGLVMALGQVIGGHPIFGVWASTALASAAICWMLFAWLPGHWALLGGILAALHPMILGWSQNYWGGAIAALGGALLLGGFRRVISLARTRDAFLMGLGIVLLANSRPYEGLALSILPLGYLFVWPMINCCPTLPGLLRQVALPLIAVILVGGAAMGYYNFRVTGNVLRLPYQVHALTYGASSEFIWQKPNPQPAEYRHREIAKFHLYTPSVGSFHDVLFHGGRKIANLAKGHFRPLVLALPLVMIPWMIHRNWMGFALLQFAVFMAAILGVRPSFPHYSAPAMGLVFVLVLQGMRHMRLCRWYGRPTGRFLVRASVLLWIISLFTTYIYLSSIGTKKGEYWALRRAQIVDQLEREDGSHLVIVRYGPNHNPNQEWVYNKAHIDGAKVVWAREMNSNDALLEYFTDRYVWLLDADAMPARLLPYRDTPDQEANDEAFSDHAGF